MVTCEQIYKAEPDEYRRFDIWLARCLVCNGTGTRGHSLPWLFADADFWCLECFGSGFFLRQAE